MPRPIRIEYPNAFYHVMNRGRGKKSIFHNSQYFLSFLECLSEANQKFGAIIHAYCLMTNHYHLILETPNSNLSRIMRHINGVYTQKYNRLRKTDGSLFRGRFKAILIDADNYLLNLNRYIHRNPIKLVEKLEDYEWSSYSKYLNLSKTPKWLNKDRTLEMLASSKVLKSYKPYVEEDGSNNFIESFYAKKNLPAVIGDKSFKKKLVVLEKINTRQIKQSLNEEITAKKIVKAVVEVFQIEQGVVLNRQSGKAKSNFPRKLAMYLCQKYTSSSLIQMRSYFNLTSVGGVSKAIFCVKKELLNNKHKRELEMIKNLLWFMD